ncbi:acetyl-CoA carboxylase biotin carboxyl carrier protein subunit [Cupriavidus respiraculi]|uniref:Biotin/lipoyl attachment protein n=1 Tax=Cupriavidus respiraculi TaxID=195930 RepID=A0ABM8X6Y0_9BURK|nr:acetyl-CoA carboxylase biotin carboxyl carrier protein subunit [Cupriavidus respiraculi]MBY4946260.1 acetyl-CoA carboxylase biotin carboxyl carrier protein subunit [Cupriavidus respiraculi]CAG9175695.1 Biotin/lipoyl attachment protein [Cupriavidus respiraculi]
MIQIEAVVSGHVCAVDVAVGATIAAGDAVMMIESMKMEIPLESEHAGVVKAILVQPGDAVAEGQVVMELV